MLLLHLRCLCFLAMATTFCARFEMKDWFWKWERKIVAMKIILWMMHQRGCNSCFWLHNEHSCSFNLQTILTKWCKNFKNLPSRHHGFGPSLSSNSNFPSNLLTKIEKKYSNYLEKFQLTSNQFFKMLEKPIYNWKCTYPVGVKWISLKFHENLFQKSSFDNRNSIPMKSPWGSWNECVDLWCVCTSQTSIELASWEGKLKMFHRVQNVRAVYQKGNARIKATWNKYGFIGGWLEPEERRLVAEEGT